MFCEKPFIKDGLAFPCQGCELCRIQRRRVWSHRIILEATQHANSSFVTLTYDEQNFPRDGCVSPDAFTRFVKRHRYFVGRKFRYFGVGEYGEQSLRPHYHIALFGLPPCVRGRTDQRRPSCCEVCDTLRKSWPYGAIDAEPLTDASAFYIAGYVTKKLTAKPLPPLLTPEFTRMSRMPGLGLGVMHDVADKLMKYEYELEDVPVALRHGKSQLPLGTYLRRKLRTMVGRDSKCPEAILEKAKEELQPLRDSAFQQGISFRKALLDYHKGKRASKLARSRIFKSRKTL